MAQGKKTFIFYSDWINLIREMDNEDAGELLKHILSYVNDENPETNNKFVKMAFGYMKPLIKSDLKKWELIRKKRKQAGAKGGKQTQANAKQMLEDAKQVQAVNVNVNVSTDVDEETPSEIEILKPYKEFIENLKNKKYEMSVDLWLMQFKGDKDRLQEVLTKDFKKQILADNKLHKNAEDVKSHFNNFLRYKK